MCLSAFGARGGDFGAESNLLKSNAHGLGGVVGVGSTSGVQKEYVTKYVDVFLSDAARKCFDFVCVCVCEQSGLCSFLDCTTTTTTTSVTLNSLF